MAPCYQYSRWGTCRFGDRCKFSHDKGQSAKAQPRDTQRRRGPLAGPKLAPESGTVTVTIDDNFPSVEAVASPHSDALIFPLEVRSSQNVLRAIHRMELSDKVPDSVSETETLIWALAQSNAFNSGWAFEDSQTLLADVTKIPGNVAVRLAKALTFPYVANNPTSTTNVSFSRYFTSEGVLKTAALSRTNTLYGILDGNLEQVLLTLKKNIAVCVGTDSFVDKSRRIFGQHHPNGLVKVVSGIQIFKPVISMLNEYVIRFRHASSHHPDLVNFVSDLEGYFNEWADNVLRESNSDPLAGRPIAIRNLIIASVRKDLAGLSQRVGSTLPVFQEVEDLGRSGPSVGLLAAIDREYDGPGELSPEGPRHSNDRVYIRDIEIPPAGDEMTAARPAYLPINIAGAKHLLPQDSMAKILDIQFRLLRADLTSGLQQGIHAVAKDFQSEHFYRTELSRRLNEGGGWYVDHSADSDSVRYGLVIHIAADAPPGRARIGTFKARSEFWETSKRMPQGGLVALITKNKAGTGAQELEVAIATLTMYPTLFRNIKVPHGSRSRFSFGIHFIDDMVGMEAVRIFQQGDHSHVQTRFLLESPVLYESVRPFLQTLQEVDDLRVPLQEYLVHSNLRGKKINMPRYMQDSPERVWDLSCLFKDDNSDVTLCQFSPHNEVSVTNARETMYEHGKLDPSQSDAVIASLCREIALIQGPPGTGKTFTGVELLRVLFANKTGPVLLLAFTNHALDHILRAIHDAGVTKDIIRLGSRSKDEIVSEYNLQNISRVKGNTSLTRIVNRCYAETKSIEKDLAHVLDNLIASRISGKRLASYLEKHYPILMESLSRPPAWVRAWLDVQASGGWEWANDRKSKRNALSVNQEWNLWKAGTGIDNLIGLHGQNAELERAPQSTSLSRVVHPPASKSKSVQNRDAEDREALATLGLEFLGNNVPGIGDHELQAIADRRVADSNPELDSCLDADRTGPTEHKGITAEEVVENRLFFLKFFGLKELPDISTTRRSMEDLLSALETGSSAWAFSQFERRQLSRKLESEAKKSLDEGSMASFQKLASRHKESRTKFEEAKDNVRVSLLKEIDLVGATTNGAAKLGSVMKGFAPKVLVIEEAGQVLEAHVLATLFPSVQHVIAIGDPLQLRPSVNVYGERN
ncbi:hypothetical protein CspHIS471_0200440 [Cutaneotrichosporon sp. HIS471]|nr:hypothetical protein CspHIS471_0200440 [Cutaneotrichosporon sp. HIS471]